MSQLMRRTTSYRFSILSVILVWLLLGGLAGAQGPGQPTNVSVFAKQANVASDCPTTDIKTVKTSGGDFNSITACLNAGHNCQVDAGTWVGGTVTASGTSIHYNTVFAAAGADRLVVMSSDISLGSTSYNQIGCTGGGLDFRTNGRTVSESLSSTRVKIIGNKFGNVASQGVALTVNASHALIDGNEFGDAATLNDDDLNIFNQYAVVRNNKALGMTETCTPTCQHPDFLQTYCVHGVTIVMAFALLENNLIENCTGADCHGFQLNNQGCDGTDVTSNYIFRYNFAYQIPSQFISGQSFSVTNTPSKFAEYNNTLGDVGAGGNQVSQFGDVGGGATFDGFEANDLFFHTMTAGGTVNVSFPTGFPLSHSLAYYAGSTYTAAGNLSTCVSSAGCKINQDPKLTNYPTNVALLAGSPAIAAGGAVATVAAGDSGNGTSLVVNNAYAFQDGTWVDGILADCIAVKTVGNHVCITAIDYTTNTITLSGTAGARVAGDSVWLYSDSNGRLVLPSAAPEIGACPFGSTGRLFCGD